jgi:hypothetical protein
VFVLPTNGYGAVLHFQAIHATAGATGPEPAAPHTTTAAASRTTSHGSSASTSSTRSTTLAADDRTATPASHPPPPPSAPNPPTTRTATITAQRVPPPTAAPPGAPTATASRAADPLPSLNAGGAATGTAAGVAAGTGLSPEAARAVVAAAYGGSAVASVLSPAAGSRATTASRMLTAAFACGDRDAASAEAVEPDYVLVVYGPPVRLSSGGDAATAGAVGALLATVAVQLCAVGFAAWAAWGADPALVGRWGLPRPGDGSGTAAAVVVVRTRDRIAGAGLGLTAAFYGPNAVELAASVAVSTLSSGADRLAAVLAAAVIAGVACALARATWAPPPPAASGASGAALAAAAAAESGPLRWVRGATWVFGDGGAAGGFARPAARLFFFEDVLAAHAVAVAAGLMPLASEQGTCVGLAVAVVAAAGLHVAYLVVVRPYGSRVEQWTTVAVAGGQLVLSLVVAASVAQGGGEGSGLLASAGWLFLAVDALVWGQLAALTVQAVAEALRKRDAPPKLIHIADDDDHVSSAPLLVAPTREATGGTPASADGHDHAVAQVNPLHAIAGGARSTSRGGGEVHTRRERVPLET